MTECCMERGCLLPQSCAQRGYCRLDHDNRRRERRTTLAVSSARGGSVVGQSPAEAVLDDDR